METPFKVVDLPTARRRRGIIIALISQAMALPDGKALEVPRNGRSLNSFAGSLYSTAARMKVKVSLTQTHESFIVWRRNGNSL